MALHFTHSQYFLNATNIFPLFSTSSYFSTFSLSQQFLPATNTFLFFFKGSLRYLNSSAVGQFFHVPEVFAKVNEKETGPS